MKFLVVSDIHGSIQYAQKAAELLAQTEADRMLLLGDCLYHGPRNALPDHYEPQAVAALLNTLKDKIIAVRGNCDTEVDQMMLEFPIMADYALIVNEGREIFATHGHVYSPQHHPDLPAGSLLLFGHIHLPIAEKDGGLYIGNPGSITLPKQNNPHSYGILDEKGFTVYDLDKNVISQLTFEE